MNSPASQKRKGLFLLKMLWLLLTCLVGKGLSEIGDCKEQEYFDNNGICRPCKQCGPGKELSKECGFGYGEDAQCLPCRPNRFKEDWGFQKCKTCLDCAIVNRYQKTNCTASANAVCGECLPGYYRKTKLGGFQDMECVPCGDPPPTYEPHCSKVNLVKISATASSPRDTALAAVICSALSTVLLALLILSVIYCKRQFMEKKPNWSSRSQEVQYVGSELSCLDRPQLTEHTHITCCHCQEEPAQACGPVHLIPSLCCDETYSMEHGCVFRSHSTLYDGNADSVADVIPAFFGSTSHSACGERAETWPLMQTAPGNDSSPVCEPHPEPIAGSADSLNRDSGEPSLFHASSVHSISGEILGTQASEHLHLPELDACRTAEESHAEKDQLACSLDDKQEC
ncbi:PREDICTED: tumor necrosis factor receptor superfamily member 19 [Nanorana parkeri]|uniref:tumor necrosis factor receptor superfamily member 19 n=1 Tax=Nanorana parkeri TaxID=125878 RepID=UPI000854B36E|nr:PREDICTED: tumor necrosis factor receptor superfamily member 19 [Nanorana parkeri]